MHLPAENFFCCSCLSGTARHFRAIYSTCPLTELAAQVKTLAEPIIVRKGENAAVLEGKATAGSEGESAVHAARSGARPWTKC